jgi:hypothetical protein
VHDERRVEHGQIVHDGLAARFDGSGQRGRFEDAAALREQELEQPLERLAPLEADEDEGY